MTASEAPLPPIQVDKAAWQHHDLRVSACRSSSCKIQNLWSAIAHRNPFLPGWVRHFPALLLVAMRSAKWKPMAQAIHPARRKGFSTFLPTLFVETMAAAPHPNNCRLPAVLLRSNSPNLPPTAYHRFLSARSAPTQQVVTTPSAAQEPLWVNGPAT